MDYLALIKAEYDAADAIQALAKSEGRGVTEAELNQLEAHGVEIKNLKAQQSRMADIEATLKRDTTAAPRSTAGPSTPAITVGADPIEKDPMAGYKNSKEMLRVIVENRGRAGNDDRLKYLAAVGSDEHNTVDGEFGGFAIPDAMIDGVLKVTPEGDPTANLVRNLPLTAPSVQLNARVDKNHNVSVVGGLVVGRQGEFGSPESSRQQMEKITLRPELLTGLTYFTDALLRDSPATVASILSDFPDAFADKEFQEKLNGTGVGQFEGVNNNPAMITVAKEGSQANGSLVLQNVAKMRARCYGYNNAIWLATHDMIPELIKIGGDSDGNGMAIWKQDSVSDIPDSLFGRPLVFTEYLPTVGQEGDLLLCDWSQYLLGTREGMKSSSSIHVRFVESQSAFKFSKENDGRGWWRSALTPKAGANTRSPFIKLGARTA